MPYYDRSGGSGNIIVDFTHSNTTMSKLRQSRVLNVILSDTFVLNAKTKGFHWNILGPQFSQVKYFFNFYQKLGEILWAFVLRQSRKRVFSCGEAFVQKQLLQLHVFVWVFLLRLCRN